MIYYSRKQTLFFCLVCMALTIAVLAMGGLLSLEAKPAVAQEHPEPDRLVQATPVSLDAEQLPAIAYGSDEQNNISVYEQYNQAVVNISTQVLGYNWFYEPIPQDGGTGSGSIIDPRGYILTNYHVVKDAYRVTVSLADGSQHEGAVIGSDEENDLALVKIEVPNKKLPVIGLGNSSNLKVGQKVLAIGNPFAFERTLTIGIISGLGRPLRSSSGTVIQDMIQTDAAINPGNSGGPLLNSAGQIIGVTTMIYSPSGGSVGIGFAVPVNTAKRVVSDLMRYGKVRRGRIDADLILLFPRLTRYAKLSVDKGLLVSSVPRGSLAEQAGLKGGDARKAITVSGKIIYLGGDIITAINKKPIDGSSDYYSALEQSKPGDVVNLEVLRDGKKLTIPVTLADRSSLKN